jgi:DNA-binding NtrC family response regulator
MLREIREGSTVEYSVSQIRAKVLVVDENLDTLLDYSPVLERAGHDVRCIGTFTDGTTSLENESFDLILISRGAPNPAESSVLARVIEEHRQTPVVVLDRFTDSAPDLEALQLTGHVYHEKSLPPSQIVELVANYLERPVGQVKGGSKSMGLR